MSDTLYLEDIFSSGGVLSKAIEGYEERDGQLEMSCLVEQCYSEERTLICEAGTGIGKSFAYLAPALKHAVEAEERTVIATSNKNLQRQLFDKDIPFLSKAIGVVVPYTLMMGRGNYICLKRLSDNENFHNLFSDDPLSDSGRFLSFVKKTETGLIEEYPGRLPQGVEWSDINCDLELCIGRKCPYIETCFFFKSRKEAEKSLIVVTNHHLLFSDANSREEEGKDYDEAKILPSFYRLVIDECHNIDRNMTSLSTEVFSKKELAYDLRRILYSKKSAQALSVVQQVAAEANEQKMGDDLADRLDVIARESESINKYLCDKLQRVSEVLIGRQNFSQIKVFREQAVLLAQNMQQAYDKANYILSRIDREHAQDELRLKTFESAFCHIAGYADLLMRFTSSLFDPGEVRYLKKLRTARGEYIVEVTIAPLSVADILYHNLFSKLPTVVCCSATLKVDSEFAYFRKQVGLDKAEVLQGNFASPFDYAHNLLFLSPQDGSTYKNDTEEEYIDSIAPRISEAIEASDGGALVLFTSYKMMQAVFEKVSEREFPFRLLIQSGNVSRDRLFAEFKSDVNSVLFATQSFWEGVDAPGDTLRLVIIAKLPFPQLKEPLFQARAEKLDSEMPHSSFRQLSMPEMMMKLKQGIGRLIRSAEDKGVVYMLDSRTNLWRSYILDQLPNVYAPEEVTAASVPERIINFLN